MTPEELYRELVDGVKGIVCPSEDMFENAAGFEVEGIRAHLQALVGSFDSGMILFINLEREHHHEIINSVPNPALNERMGNRVYIVRAFDDEGRLTCLSVKQCSGTDWNAFTVDLLAAQKRVDYIRRYCPALPSVNKVRDTLILDSISALNVCLNRHIAGGVMRLLDLAALDELLYEWCERYGQYQFLEMIVKKTKENDVTCVLYTQHPKTLNTDFLIKRFKNGSLIERGEIDNNLHTIKAIIDPATVPASCKIIQINNDAREIILTKHVEDAQPQDKGIYDINRYSLQQMKQAKSARDSSLRNNACTFFAATALPVVSAMLMYAVGKQWRSANNL